jgi:F-type H+-transporting ATPase subunit b
VSNRLSARRRTACELMNKLVLSILVVVGVLTAPGITSAQEPGAQPKPQPESHDAPTTATEHDDPAHAGEEHGMLASLLWPTVNFAILVGGLWWFLKLPIATYLSDRHASIRKDLVEAANVSTAASAQLHEIERKLQALPGEIEALKRRGAEEITAEEQRISAAAAAERDRLLEQTRREIDLQVRLAKRALLEHAADLSVRIAGERIKATITPADHERIVERYLDQVKGH